MAEQDYELRKMLDMPRMAVDNEMMMMVVVMVEVAAEGYERCVNRTGNISIG